MAIVTSVLAARCPGGHCTGGCTGCWPLLAGAGSEADMSVTALPRHTTLYTLPALPAYPGADHNHNTNQGIVV